MDRPIKVPARTSTRHPRPQAIYEGASDSPLGLYLLPLLVWHPAQLVVGSALAPRLAAWVERQTAAAEGVADESV